HPRDLPSFPTRRSSDLGILTSCSPTPATGSRVHRGSAVNPRARSTPRQNSRPRSAVVTVLPRLRLPISHLLGRVPPPPRVGRDRSEEHTSELQSLAYLV